jgi:hypothetical protein
MANEFQQLPNPDDVPGAVSSGYQRQNTNMLAIQTGLDTTEPYDNGAGNITVPMGGVIEVSGVMFKLSADITIPKPDINTAYWIAITDNGDGTATAAPVTRPGAWDPARQGCYRSDGSRTLNWVSLGMPSGSLGAAVFSKTTKGDFTTTLQKKGWYYADLRSGSGAGNGGNASGTTPGGGGIPGNVSGTNYKLARKIFFSEESTKTITGKVGGSGFNGGAGGQGSSSTVGAGGGGGSGAGEETVIHDPDIRTGEVPGGNGGNASGTSSGQGGGGGGYNAGGSPTGQIVTGGPGTDMYGGNGGNSVLGSPGGSAGRSSPGSNGTAYTGSSGGGGGGMGAHGRYRPDGDPAAGYCNIYKLEN